jgi:hypothetical protein
MALGGGGIAKFIRLKGVPKVTISQMIVNLIGANFVYPNSMIYFQIIFSSNRSIEYKLNRYMILIRFCSTFKK